jgi:hypothetical protein
MTITSTLYITIYEPSPCVSRVDSSLTCERFNQEGLHKPAPLLRSLRKAEQGSSQLRCVTISSLSSQKSHLHIGSPTRRKLASQQNSSNAPAAAAGYLLPAPHSADDAVKLDVSQGLASVKYDTLGPLVVNSDGVSAVAK